MCSLCAFVLRAHPPVPAELPSVQTHLSCRTWCIVHIFLLGTTRSCLHAPFFSPGLVSAASLCSCYERAHSPRPCSHQMHAGAASIPESLAVTRVLGVPGEPPGAVGLSPRQGQQRGSGCNEGCWALAAFSGSIIFPLSNVSLSKGKYFMEKACCGFFFFFLMLPN